jgi:ABC-type multidrug transport system ATPase subunit
MLSTQGVATGGVHTLYDNLAATLTPAVDGETLPQVEIRSRHLSISADVQVTSNADGQRSTELPTLLNDLKQTVAKFTANKQTARKQILKDVTMVLRPGTMTLVLGQPGSGKSSLMRVLSGTFPVAKNVEIDGHISYNGRAQHEIRDRLPQLIAYTPQRDEHYPVLTVEETLSYANSFNPSVLYRHHNKFLTGGDAATTAHANGSLHDLNARFPDVVVQQLGLETCQGTVIGNEMLRGVSGGEKKRVTLGEMSFGLRPAAFMDEISTGLDASATFDIIKANRKMAEQMRATLVISLLQPSPEVLELFDDVLLLNAGEVMYYGPVQSVDSYFASLGFERPVDRDVADFLLDLGTPQQVRYQRQPPASGLSIYLRQPSEFADRFRTSDIFSRTLEAVDEPVSPSLQTPFMTKYLTELPTFGRSFFENAWTLTARQVKVAMRNTAYLKSRAFLVTFMALIYGSVFWQFDPDNAQVVEGVAYQASMFLVLSLSSQLPINMAQREVFYKQRRANFFQTAAYVMACSVSQIPFAIAESVVFGSILYWMCGFVADAAAFVIFLLLLILNNLTFLSWFFFLSAAAPNLNVLKPFAMYTDLLFNMFSGFLITPGLIPDWLIWLYWINPLSWCFRSLVVNNYRSPALDVCVYDGVDYCSDYGMTMGEYSLSLYDIKSGKEWIWYGVLFLVGFYLVCTALAFVVLEFKRHESPKDGAISGESSPDGSVKSTQLVDGEYVAVGTPKGPMPDIVAIGVNVSHDHPTVPPVVLAFQDLWYSVPKPGAKNETIDLLKNVSGYALPRTMTALMGSSGAGKTTLMDVIAGRKTGGSIKGKVMLNGHQASALAIQRTTGYCEQTDVHLDSSTIREALTFSAFLRQDSSVPDEAKYASVDECIKMLDLGAIAGQIVRACSPEQLKRLTIGVEIAAQPSVLFLDEPTSGLDARTAKIIMDGVRRVADSGRTVLCTIHQPSSEVFALFDSLLLLKRGGQTVFFGDLGANCGNLVEYFEAIRGVAPLDDDYNPATWMLECIGAGVDSERKIAAASVEVDFADHFAQSKQRQALTDMLGRDGVGCESALSAAMSFDRKRASSSMTQLVMLTRRSFNQYWRTPSYNVTRFTVSIALALLFGVLYVDVDYESYQGVNAGLGLIYISTVFVGWVPFNAVIPVTTEQRTVFYRERASQTYGVVWYLVAESLVEIPYTVMSTLVFTVIFFPMVGFSDFLGFSTGVLYWVNAMVSALTETYMAQLFVYVFPSIEIAIVLGVMWASVGVVVMGFNPPANAIPIGYKWLYYIMPQTYSMSVFSALVFADCPAEATDAMASDVGVGCMRLADAPSIYANLTAKEYVELVFKTKYDDIALNLWVQVAFLVLFVLFKLIALRFVNHQKR